MFALHSRIRLLRLHLVVLKNVADFILWGENVTSSRSWIEPRFFLFSQFRPFLLRNVDITFSQFSKFNFVVHLLNFSRFFNYLETNSINNLIFSSLLYSVFLVATATLHHISWNLLLFGKEYYSISAVALQLRPPPPKSKRKSPCSQVISL